MRKYEVRDDVTIVGYRLDSVFYKAKYYADNHPSEGLITEQGGRYYLTGETIDKNRWRFYLPQNEVNKFLRFEKDCDNKIEHTTLEEYLSKRGYGSPVNDYMIDKMKLPHGQSLNEKNKMVRQANVSSEEYHSERNKLIAEYNEKVSIGKIIPKSAMEITFDKALGHSDNESTKAANRMLEKRIEKIFNSASEIADMQKNILKKQIEELAKEYRESPEKLAELAAFKSKFYRYSMRNTMLILKQNSGAAFVGSFQKFKEIGKRIAIENGQLDSNGREPYWGVKLGQVGLKIFVPVQATYISVNGENILLSKASAEQKALVSQGKLETFTKLHFKLGTVFDISQTKIPTEYYPQIYSMGYNSQEHAQIYDALKAYIENVHNCPVAESIDNSIALRGVCYTGHTTKYINLNEKLNDTQRLSTLTHEFGHFLMHRNLEDVRPTCQKEVEADIYNIMLNAHLGIETTDVRTAHLAESYKQYISTLKDENIEKGFESVFENANKAFSETINQLDDYINIYINQQQEQAQEDIIEEVFEI